MIKTTWGQAVRGYLMPVEFLTLIVWQPNNDFDGKPTKFYKIFYWLMLS